MATTPEVTLNQEDLAKLRDAVRAEFLGKKFGGSFRKFRKFHDDQNGDGVEKLAILRRLLYIGSTSAQERSDEKKGHHQMYGEMIRELTQEKTRKSFSAIGLPKNPQFVYNKSVKRWLTADENRKVNFNLTRAAA